MPDGSDSAARREARPLRLWPGVVIVAFIWLVKLVVPLITREMMSLAVGMAGGTALGALALLVWWAFFSRAHWAERWGAIVLMVAAIIVTPPFLHETVRMGNAGFQFYFHVIPALSLTFVLWAVVTRRRGDRFRRVTMVATILLTSGAFTLLRSDGISSAGPQFGLRWGATHEDRLLAREADPPAALASAPAATQSPEERVDWPGFGGRNRDGQVPGARTETRWSESPPVELWRRPIGPGVSSFAAHGDLLYTQEQRGEEEIVACYRVTTGEPVWKYRDTTRFSDAYVGAGPRATPALSDGRLYAFGATGILNALDARDGSLVWSRDAAADTGAELPFWGFVSSPLVVDDVVIVHTDALVAYDVANGDRRWVGPSVGQTYSSPHLLEIDGVEQVLLVTNKGVMSVALADGELLWEHAWPGIGVLQPALTPNGDLLINLTNEAAMPIGTRRLTVALNADLWTVTEHWTSKGLKSSHSPVVVHEGHVYGLDGRFLACIDVESGERRWKGGRYGLGQILLLPDQDLLLVLSERGELALVEATPDKHSELGRFQAIEGKSWTQPAIVGNVLLVRNSQEMAAFRLSGAGG